MGVILTTSSHGQTVDVPAGVSTGVLLLTHNDVAFVGHGIGVSTILADATYPYFIQAGAIVGGGPCLSVTFQDLTLDCAGLTTMVCALASSAGGGPLLVRLVRVRITNHARGTIALLNQTFHYLEDVEIAGLGGAYQIHTTAWGHEIRGLTVTGCMWGILVSDGATAGVISGGDQSDVVIKLDWFANPKCESGLVPTAWSPYYVDVADHAEEHRNLYDSVRLLIPIGTWIVGDPLPVGAEEWARVELADGRWSQILYSDDDLEIVDKWKAIASAGAYGPLVCDAWRAAQTWNTIAEPTGQTATLYRVLLGRLGGWTATRLSLRFSITPTAETEPTYSTWRTVNGDAYTLPAGAIPVGTRVDVLRHAYTGQAAADGVRDVDIGGIHVTKSARDSVFDRIYVRGGFSDMQTYRGVRTKVYRAVSAIGQDMAYTIDGNHDRQYLAMCRAVRAGFHGFLLLLGPSDIYLCHTNNNGRHGDGAGVAIAEDDDTDQSTIVASTSGDVSGGFTGPITANNAPGPGALVRINRARNDDA